MAQPLPGRHRAVVRASAASLARRFFRREFVFVLLLPAQALALCVNLGWKGDSTWLRPLVNGRSAAGGEPFNLQHLVIPFARTRLAQYPPGAQNFAAEVDAFAALGADDTVAFVSGKFFGGEFYPYPLLGE